MRKILLVLALFLLLGCNLLGNAPAAAETSEKETQTTPQSGQASQPTGGAASATVEIIPIPAETIQLEGVPYSAYQLPGDPFRFVCQDPCPLDPQYIYAEYAGFRQAHDMLIRLTGIDTLAELQPVDMHLVLEDSICSELPVGHAYWYADTHLAYTCTEGPGYYPTIEEKIRMAALPERQYFPLHEYMHTIFFGRISGKTEQTHYSLAESFHDYVVPIPSYAIGILDLRTFCTYRDPLPPGDYDGYLINELCRRNDFQLEFFTQSLIELDALYQSGGGEVYYEEYEHPVPSVAQYRDILNRLLGGDTTPAFAAACWPPELFDNSYVLSGECAPPEISGTPTAVQ